MLRDALPAARKDRDTARVSALRSALSAIDNAETGGKVAAAPHLYGPATDAYRNTAAYGGGDPSFSPPPLPPASPPMGFMSPSVMAAGA